VTERLLVVYEAEVVASLERQDDGRLKLTFAERVIEDAEGRVLLSASLPVRREPYTESDLMPFFDGLLPEEQVRQRLAIRLRLEPNDAFGFLREIGRECAGAFSIIPEGIDPVAAGQEGVAWLSEDALATTINDLAARPLGIETAMDIRISLAGAQDKLVVVIDNGRIGLPRGTTPSTHILKPASQVRSGRSRNRAFPGLVPNEAFCMKLAELSGLNVAPVEMKLIDMEPAIIIKRYDREHFEGGVRRLHQEDFCQALGVLPYRKYEKDGGPGLPQYLNLIGRYSSRVVDDEPELIDRVAFNYTIGNADAHAKNFSLLYPELGVARLAPAYDLISTHVYSQLTHDMATSINGTYDSRAIEAVHWRKEIVRLGLREQLYSGRLADLADRIEAAVPDALAWIEDGNMDNTKVQAVAALVRRRAGVLRGIKDSPSIAASRGGA
jgi:serine/threonine-protein kinase HipA